MRGCVPLTETQVRKVGKAFGSIRDHTLFIVGHRTGLRISELLSLTVKDVCVDGRVLDRVYVRRHNVKGKSSGRSIVLHKQARTAIGRLLKLIGTDPETFLFKSRKGQNKPLKRHQAWAILRKALRAAKVSTTGTHVMRKTFAKRVHSRLGKDITKTMKALGHEDLRSTISYLSFDSREIDDAIKDL